MLKKEAPILIVDDMLAMRHLLRNSLQELGFVKITEAANGQEAWNKIKLTLDSNHHFELIICDSDMPQMKGLDLLRKCRSVGKLKNIPFILLASESDSELVAEAIQYGVSTYMVKPLTTKTLEEKINLACAAHFNAA